MIIPRMILEDWFDQYQYQVEYDLGQSAISTRTVQELHFDLADIKLRYGHHQGLPELREIIASQYPGLTADDIIVTTGASEAISILALTILSSGDHCIVEHPTYPTLYEVPRRLGAEVELFQLLLDHHWCPDWTTFKKLIRPETRLISLSHPNNPTGAVISESDLLDVVALADRLGTPLLVDETYRDLSYGAAPPPVASLSDRAISISTMSKCYGVPGLRIGWIAARNRKLIQQLVNAREYLTITNNTIGEVLALTILQNSKRYLTQASQQVAANLETITRWMATQRRLAWVPPRGGVVSLARIVDVDELGAQHLYRTLTETYRTFIVPGGGFELPATFFRIGIGAHPTELSKGLECLSAVLADSKDKITTFATDAQLPGMPRTWSSSTSTAP